MLNNYRVICLILSLMLVIPAMAQDTKSQKNSKRTSREYLPVAGNFSFGISATPLVNFVGNMFNGTANQQFGEIGGETLLKPVLPTVSIMGKYMFKDNLAIRVNIGIIKSSVNNGAYVTDDNAVALDPLSMAKVEDHVKERYTGGSIAVGLEYRIGKGRIQGVFSGSLLYANTSSKNKYSYGNAITAENQMPTIDETNGNAYIPISTAIPHARMLNNFSTKSINSLGLVGSVGVEWFVAPKFSVGFEVNLAAIQTWNPSTYNEFEGYNTYSQVVETYTDVVSPSGSEFYVGTNNIGSNLTLNFFF